jgi:hypothetical protein
MPRRSEEAASFDVGLILPQCIDKIVSFIPVLSSIPAEDIARWPEAKKRDDGVLVLGGLEPYYHPSVIALRKSFYENHFVQPFDWVKWQSTAVKIFNEPNRLSKATLKTCPKLITLHVRKDRFVGGHFGEMVRCGHIAVILYTCTD